MWNASLDPSLQNNPQTQIKSPDPIPPSLQVVESLDQSDDGTLPRLPVRSAATASPYLQPNTNTAPYNSPLDVHSRHAIPRTKPKITAQQSPPTNAYGIYLNSGCLYPRSVCSASVRPSSLWSRLPLARSLFSLMQYRMPNSESNSTPMLPPRLIEWPVGYLGASDWM